MSSKKFWFTGHFSAKCPVIEKKLFMTNADGSELMIQVLIEPLTQVMFHGGLGNNVPMDRYNEFLNFDFKD